jgi:hypothetical protein
MIDFSFGQSPSYLATLLGEEEAKRAQANARSQGLLGFASALLANSGYSREPVSLGQVFGNSFMQGQKSANDAYSQSVNDKMNAMKIAQMDRDLKAKQVLQTEMPNLIKNTMVDPGRLGVGQPIHGSQQSRRLLEEQGAFMDEDPQGAMQMLTDSVNFNAGQGKVGPAEAFRLPSYKRQLNQDALSKIAGALSDDPTKFNQVVTSAKAMDEMYNPEPKYQSLGNVMYRIEKGKRPEIAIDNRGLFTDRYANVARGLQLSTDSSLNTAAQNKQILDKVLEQDAASGGIESMLPGRGGRTEVEKTIMNAAESLQNLNQMISSFDPKFLQYAKKFEMGVLKAKDKVGTLSETERADLEDYTRMRQDAFNFLNSYIKSISGAAVTVQEADRLLEAIPNPGKGIFDGDGPTEYRTKLNNVYQDLQMAMARAAYIRRSGFALTEESMSKIELSEMPTIMRREAESIRDEILSQYPDIGQADLKARSSQELAKRFGLPHFRK